MSKTEGTGKGWHFFEVVQVKKNVPITLNSIRSMGTPDVQLGKINPENNTREITVPEVHVTALGRIYLWSLATASLTALGAAVIR
jgi:hypothetical protein